MKKGQLLYNIKKLGLSAFQYKTWYQSYYLSYFKVEKILFFWGDTF